MRTTADKPRAAPVRIPQPTRALMRARAELEAHRAAQLLRERRGLARGLMLLALAVLLLSMARAGMERVFLHGWWRHW